MKLTPDELERALTVLEEANFSVFFPPAFEVNALRHSMKKISPILTNLALENYTPHPCNQLVAQKQKYTVRPVHIANPIDTLLLTGVVLRLAPIIEKARVPISKKTVFSHRLDSFSETSVLSKVTGFPDFEEERDQRLNENEYMITTDIVDFYPRIYLHRLENSLQALTGKNNEVAIVMHFLSSWANGTSYGIPTGPPFSGILAEALLHEVDDYLLSRGLNFIRYLDDYCFFGNTEGECIKAVALLGDRLHQTQGLSLNMAKTDLYSRFDYKKENSRHGATERLLHQEVIRKVFRGDPYAKIDYKNLTQKQKDLIDSLKTRKILEDGLKKDRIADLKSVKFVLNVLSALGQPKLVDMVIDNMNRLGPVIETVARFLNVFDSLGPIECRKIADRIVEFIGKSDFILDHQLMWLLEPFACSKDWNHLNFIRQLANGHLSPNIRRQAILALGQIGDRSSLLDIKSQVHHRTDWEKRAIIFACRNLPKDEAKAFFRDIRRHYKNDITKLAESATIDFAESYI